MMQYLLSGEEYDNPVPLPTFKATQSEMLRLMYKVEATNQAIAELAADRHEEICKRRDELIATRRTQDAAFREACLAVFFSKIFNTLLYTSVARLSFIRIARLLSAYASVPNSICTTSFEG